MLFLGAFYLVVPKLLSLLSITINALFIDMLRRHNCLGIIGTYRRLMYFFAAWNILTAITDAITTLAVQNVGQTVVVFIPDRTFSLLGPIETGIFLLRVTLIFSTLQITAVHFFYRYLLIKNEHFLWKFLKETGEHFFDVSICFTTLALFALLLAAWLEPAQVVPMLNTFFMETFEEASPKYIIINRINLNSPKAALCTFVFLTLLLASTAVCPILGYLTYHSLKTGEGLSYQTIKVHIQLIKLLGVMCVIPGSITWLFFCLPILAGFLEIPVEPVFYTIPSVLMSLSPLLTPLAMILSSRSLRRCFLAYFQPSTIPVTVVQPRY